MNKLLDDKLRNQQDELYAALMQAHDGLSFTQSARLNAKLALLLANQIGDIAVLRELIALARSPMDSEPSH